MGAFLSRININTLTSAAGRDQIQTPNLPFPSPSPSLRGVGMLR